MARLDPSRFFEDNLATAELEIPELGGTITVRAMSAAEQDDYELKLALGQFKTSYRAYIAYHCTVNDDGTLFFARELDGQPVPAQAVIAELGEKNAWGILDRIATKVRELSGAKDRGLGEEPDASAAKKKSFDLKPVGSSG